MIIDSHCHYNLKPLVNQWEKHWQKAQEHGVKQAIIVGTNPESSQLALKRANQDQALFATVGIHPHEAADLTIDDMEKQIAKIKKLANKMQPVAIGEVGLDYYWLENDEKRAAIIEKQQTLLKKQIEIANQTKLPIILHVRDKNEEAYWDTLEVLENNYRFNQPFILHCISGPVKYLKKAVEMGGYIGVAANCTYPNADQIRKLVETCPPDKILLETDAPYLPPQSHRGETCHPWMIAHTAQYLQENFNLDLAQIEANTRKCFQI